MAIDSAEKRRSVAGVPFLPLGPGVTPNASKDAEWRQQAGWGYSGIAVVAAVVVLAAITLKGKRDFALTLKGKRDFALALIGKRDHALTLKGDLGD